MTVTYSSLHDTEIDMALANPIVAVIVAHILKSEGGYENNGNDSGGTTMDGISLRYARGIGLDLNGDGVIDGKDIMLVTPDIAGRLFVEDFFIVPRINSLPDCFWGFLMDFAVNSGPGRALINFQQVLNELRTKYVGEAGDSWLYLMDDGRPGTKTINTAHVALSHAGFPVIVNALCDDRAAYLTGLVTNMPSKAVFLKGWLNRVDSFRLHE